MVKNQVFLHQKAKNAPFFIYAFVIINERKKNVIFFLQSPLLICNIWENDVAAGARSNHRLQPIGPSGLLIPLIFPQRKLLRKSPATRLAGAGTGQEKEG